MISSDIGKAVEALQLNEVIAIPTETVYGLAANAFNESAVKKIYELKQRPLYNPLIVHIKSVDFLPVVARDIPERAIALAQEFWPGPLTLVLKKQEVVPDIVTAGKDTVAIRIPRHPQTLALLHELDFPLAAPSANPFGSISPTTSAHVERYFGDRLSLILEGGSCDAGIESTIIGFEGDQAVLYRLGSLSIEDLEARVGKIETRNRDDHSPLAPGMISRHYAPSTKTIVSENLIDSIREHSNKRVGLLLFEPHSELHFEGPTEVLSPGSDLKEAARNLYAAMHRLDQLGLDLIIACTFPDEGIGKTLNDKLKRASHDQ